MPPRLGHAQTLVEQSAVSVTTIAGDHNFNHSSGTVEMDGIGREARFNRPNNVAFDPSTGNIMVTDCHNFTVCASYA